MIGLVHSSSQEKKPPTTNSTSSLGKVDHNCKYIIINSCLIKGNYYWCNLDILEHSLHQLLRHVHVTNAGQPAPHPSSAPLGPTKRRRLAGPQAFDRHELLLMTKRLYHCLLLGFPPLHLFFFVFFFIQSISKTNRDQLIRNHSLSLLQWEHFGTDHLSRPTRRAASEDNVRHRLDRPRDSRSSDHIALERAQFADFIMRENYYHDSRLRYAAADCPRRPRRRENAEMYLSWRPRSSDVLRTARIEGSYPLPSNDDSLAFQSTHWRFCFVSWMTDFSASDQHGAVTSAILGLACRQ